MIMHVLGAQEKYEEQEPFTFSAINDTLLSENESGLTAATGPAQHISDYCIVVPIQSRRAQFCEGKHEKSNHKMRASREIAVRLDGPRANCALATRATPKLQALRKPPTRAKPKLQALRKPPKTASMRFKNCGKKKYLYRLFTVAPAVDRTSIRNKQQLVIFGSSWAN
jgi:hypothetical protein